MFRDLNKTALGGAINIVKSMVYAVLQTPPGSYAQVVHRIVFVCSFTHFTQYRIFYQ